MPASIPTVTIRAGKEKLLRTHHPWGFSGAIQKMSEPAPDGSLVRVVDSRGHFIAYGAYNGKSQTALRLLEWDAEMMPDADWWRTRISRALLARGRILASPGTNACRLIHGEADFLPGIVCDYYAGYLVLQITAAVAEVRKEAVVSFIRDACREFGYPAHGLYERGDLDVRRLEGLSEVSGVRWGSEPPDDLWILENGFSFPCPIRTGQKSGFYCDQRENRLRVSAYCEGKTVLDAFCYSGAFGVHALRGGATAVSFIDSSADAVALSRASETRNFDELERRASFETANIFEYLRAAASRGDTFDCIIIDPPKLAMSSAHLSDALRAYKDLNLWAIRSLAAGGILATFSCSGRVSREEFRRAIAWAATDAGRDIQILETLGQPPDHPVRISFPESEYLKGYVLRVIV